MRRVADVRAYVYDPVYHKLVVQTRLLMRAHSISTRRVTAFLADPREYERLFLDPPPWTR